MVTLYVEGGRDSKDQKVYQKDLNSECRRGFRKFITNAGIAAPTETLRIVPCGGRGSARKDFRTAIAQGENAMLLVDSEKPVSSEHERGENTSNWRPWDHLEQSDNWHKPNGCNDTHCHLMVQVMESWFLADPDNLKAFFGAGFNSDSLPAETDPIESIRKGKVFAALKEASQNTQKGAYKKSAHSFELLSCICPDKVTKRSPWARRFVDELRKRITEYALYARSPGDSEDTYGGGASAAWRGRPARVLQLSHPGDRDISLKHAALESSRIEDSRPCRISLAAK